MKYLGSYLIMNMPYIFYHLEPYIIPILIQIEILRFHIRFHLILKPYTLLVTHFAHYTYNTFAMVEFIVVCLLNKIEHREM